MVDLISIFTILVLAIFVGFEVIAQVPPILQTPLMSGSNAISGITLIGAIIVAGTELSALSTALGFIAVVFATINVVAGFLVTHRMVEKFQKKRGNLRNNILTFLIPLVIIMGLSPVFFGSSIFIDLSYLLASVLFIFAFIGLKQPHNAVSGNLLGASGMIIAATVTLFDLRIVSYLAIVLGVVTGTVISIYISVKVAMTAMPQLVGLLNGLGGAASVLVAGSSLVIGGDIIIDIATVVSGIIGAITFFGSLVASAKLQGLISDKPLLFKGHNGINFGLLFFVIVLGVWFVSAPDLTNAYWIIVVVSSGLGILLILPIGGADMPIVISLLNSYSGLAAASTGFVLNNSILVISGALVGASGIILTSLMCKAMNRSLINVLFGGFGAAPPTAPKEGDIYAGKVKSTSPEEVAMLLNGARNVMIVPGYGLAVGQAQHAVRDLMNLLEAQETNVEIGIHPVAGRMPGHMNILLAEANVPYEKLKEIDQANADLEETDVALVIGANDTVNPLAKTDPKSPISGMPIIEVSLAKTVVVIKRGLGPGFAGIPNPLFTGVNTLMLFGDAKQMLLKLITALKEM